MKRALATLILCGSLVSLGGCVLAIGNDAGDDSSWSSGSSDNSLARAVRARFDGDQQLHDLDIRISTEHGRVYLSGNLSDPQLLSHAVQLALETPDVKSVRCSITVIK
jgi:osmotically-inducible protein OsmY